MMEREQIVKALECCINCDCRNCPSNQPEAICVSKLMKNALALIKELTEENEKIRESECNHCACELLDQRDKAREEAERYKRYYFHHEYDKWEAEIKVETVRKMQNSLKEYLDDFYNLGEDALLDVPDLIDQVAEEVLEGKNDV